MDALVFNNMALKQKEAIIKLAGDHIDLRFEPRFTVYLYDIFGIRVEAFHHRRSGLIAAEAVSNNRLHMYGGSKPAKLGTSLRNLLKGWI